MDLTMEKNKIYNEDCLKFMARADRFADIVLTSPPYNTDRSNGTAKNYSARYEGEYQDTLTNEEYINWTLDLFKGFEKILKENGTILYNISYGSENNELLWLLISEIIQKSNFTTADCIVWKKPNALVNNTSAQHLTRICEFVFVFCRKSEYQTYKTNKQVVSTRETGQNMYGNVVNFIEAPNNDGSCDIHKATYSSLLCRKLLNIYAPQGSVIYDPFMGTGTTAVACIKDKYEWVGTEISPKFTEYANKRIEIAQSESATLF